VLLEGLLVLEASGAVWAGVATFAGERWRRGRMVRDAFFESIAVVHRGTAVTAAESVRVVLD
jgi:hypothetical protein